MGLGWELRGNPGGGGGIDDIWIPPPVFDEGTSPPRLDGGTPPPMADWGTPPPIRGIGGGMDVGCRSGCGLAEVAVESKGGASVVRWGCRGRVPEV